MADSGIGSATWSSSSTGTSEPSRTASQPLGMFMHGSTPGEITARLKADIAKWADVIEKAGIPKRD
jgi:hypothetical protein